MSPNSLSQIANFAVTYKCNSKCKTCNIWKIPNPEEQKLSINEIQEFFESNNEYLKNVKSVQLTGGEPFLRDDLADIVRLFVEHIPECVIWIPTNGISSEVITSTVNRILVDKIRLGISVSIDGIGNTHDVMRGVEGCYDNCLETLASLSSLNTEHPSFTLSVGMTLTPSNYHQTLEVYRLSKQYYADFSLRPVHQSDIYYRNQLSNSLKPHLEELMVMFRIIARDIKDDKGLKKSVSFIRYLRGVLDYIQEPHNRTLPCSAGTSSIFLNPYGDVYPCIMMNEKLGNIRDENLFEIMSSEKAENARGVISNLVCPKCWVECETYRDIWKDKIGLIETGLFALLDPQNLGFR